MQRIKIRRNFLRSVSCCLALLLCLLGWAPDALGDWRDDVGYTKLIGILGAAAPTGAGVPISFVEAPTSSGKFFPNTSNSEFGSATDPLGIQINFTNGSTGQGTGTSGHADNQGEIFFGNTLSVAPAANEVTVYEANDYLSNRLNMDGGSSLEPDVQDFRVQNFSWIGTFATPLDGTPDPTIAELNNDREALRRFDFAIEANNITALVGVQNAPNPLPHLLSHSYNSITVGRSVGNHGTGYTRLDGYGIGRSKPDLVAPPTTSSAATAATSSAATFLHSSDTVLGTDAAKSVTMKAILLAGATKDEFPTWSQIDGSGEWHPLDDTFGAGELNLYNSYLSTLGGQSLGNTTTPTSVSSHGWDYQTVQPGAGNELLYDFVIPTGSSAAELSIILTWNTKIVASFDSGDPVIANLALELVDDAGMTIDFDINDNLVEGLSDSDVDNVEHLYLTNLAAGTYTLKVSSDDLASDFGLAWRTSTLFDAFSADFDEDGDIDGSDFLAWQRGNGTLINASHASGDADADGDVDAEDLAILNAALNPGSLSIANLALAVPEPATLGLALAGLLLLAGMFYRQAATR